MARAPENIPDMDHDPMDETTTTKIPESTRGESDANAEDLSLSGGSGDPPPPKKRGLSDQMKAMIQKNPYKEFPQDDKDNPMTTFLKEKSGLLSFSKSGEGTADTSFITGGPSGRVLNAKDMATLEVEKDYPNMDHSKVEA